MMKHVIILVILLVISF
ncbi:type I toxin-antitoxin system Ibs family toxin [Escherichia coli]|nr:type I toxin-antitoxin system Ibs family toxin [Escherichia coli]EFW8097412.1 type I toxin-antitoxin system Ibs family toxin [Shigella sonnei]EHY1704338.1 type I toxin-antitoxin system Ibs family toxin [Escherichia coli O21]AWJ30320.1 type I toxin-antitoxin system Ibs family toxin [Escherichia coli O121 str. RM8352]EEC9376154.1 type I toxin-antitoxin system Ibs family toxin [Escherichia coli]EEC9597042.1 type I toxin-antitoxin system Ibs family toxin [Escherichia coli]